jgi:hypothetical protein
MTTFNGLVISTFLRIAKTQKQGILNLPVPPMASQHFILRQNKANSPKLKLTKEYCMKNMLSRSVFVTLPADEP